MRILIILTALLSFLQCPAFASSADSASRAEAAQAAMVTAYLDSVDHALPYKTGTVPLRQFASLTIPEGYKFLPEQESQWLLEKVWGNPARENVMGMLVRKDFSLNGNSWAFVYTYDESGYVKDEDADDINYDEMLTEIQKSEPEINKERVAAGYDPIHMVSWASKPFYDKENKVLHWAKEIQFGQTPLHTLNYDVRILGRKGVLSVNAVGTIDQLADIKQNIPSILHAATFSSGYRYKDFDPSVDKVAAYTIGGLIAGKLLLKAGFWALIAKNIKLIVFGILGIFGGLRKKIARLFRRRKEEEEGVPGIEPDLAPATDAIAPADILTIDPTASQEIDRPLKDS